MAHNEVFSPMGEEEEVTELKVDQVDGQISTMMDRATQYHSGTVIASKLEQVKKALNDKNGHRITPEEALRQAGEIMKELDTTEGGENIPESVDI